MNANIMNHSNGLSGKREQLVCLASGCLVFLISLIISSLYTEGDQEGYHNVYKAVSGLGFDAHWSEIRIIYLSRIYADEWGHLLVSLIGGGLDIDKNLLMSLVNGILAAYTVRLLLFWGGSLWIATGLVLTNYYFYVLYFAAERLKFALLFLVLALLCSRKPLGFAANTLMSLFSHFSVVFIYCGIWLTRLHKKLAKRDRMGYWTLILSLVVLSLFLAWNWEYLYWKFNIYLHTSEPLTVSKLLPLIILLALSSLYAKHRWEPLLALLPILVGVAILDGSRLNMLGFFIFLYYGIQAKAGLNAGVIAVMLYFSYKTIMFVKTIFILGHGFGVSE